MISVEASNGVCRARVAGEMTIYCVAEMKGELLSCIDRDTEVEIDLSEVSEMDTAGFQLLLLAKREAAAGQARSGQCRQTVAPGGTQPGNAGSAGSIQHGILFRRSGDDAARGALITIFNGNRNNVGCIPCTNGNGAWNAPYKIIIVCNANLE